METTLLIGEQYIREWSVLNNNVEVTDIQKSAYYMQDLIIQPILGTTFYEEIMTAYSGATNGGAPLTDDQTTLLEYIKPALLHHAAAETTFFLTLNVKNKGVQTQRGDFSDSVSENTMFTVKAQITKRANFYEERLRIWLCDNASLFPTYKSSTNQSTDMTPDTGKSAYNSPIGFYKSNFNRMNNRLRNNY